MQILKQNWRWTKPTLALIALMAALLHTTVAKADIVTVTGAFGNYHGAVENGLVGGLEWQTFINGSAVGPTEPIPGLEDQFIPPDPSDPFALGTGLGFANQPLFDSPYVEFNTSSFNPDTGEFTNFRDNFLGFTPGPAANVNKGDEFLLGTFDLTNGIFWAAVPYHDFTFSITTHSDNPALDGHVFSDTVRLVITGNCFVQPSCSDAGIGPEQNADYFYFLDHPELGTMSVYEAEDSPTGTNFGSIDLYGKIGSLIPTEFLNPVGGVFVGPAIVVTPTPEPATLALLVSGLIGLAGLKRKRA